MAIFVIIGFAGLFGVKYYQFLKSPEYEAEKELENLMKQYAEDSYGGDTPEETLRLFIKALKEGDTDLAAKYFILDKQEQWKNDLSVIKEKGLLEAMVKDLDRKKFVYTISDDQIAFDISNDDNEAILSILFGRGSNYKWKILDF